MLEALNNSAKGFLTASQHISLTCIDVRGHRQVGRQGTRGQQCLPKLLRFLDALISGIYLCLISLHELVALQNGNQPLCLGIPLHQTLSVLADTQQKGQCEPG